MDTIPPPVDPARLESAWTRLAPRPCPDGLPAALLAAWAEPHRAYHNLSHLAACLALLDEARPLAALPDELEVALWFHDAVYDPRRSDNESCSAAWASDALLASGAPAEVAERVVDLILSTRHDQAPSTPDGSLLVDIDLAILGSPIDSFAGYDLQIRREYAWVPEPDYRAGRAAVLRKFLARSPLYATPFFRDRLEAAARFNLTRAIAGLEG
jgi:predicted metal-dependent HD superfamily phosphohydrolase